MIASSWVGRAASKIAPQIGTAAGQILIPAKLLVQLKGHLCILSCQGAGVPGCQGDAVPGCPGAPLWLGTFWAAGGDEGGGGDEQGEPGDEVADAAVDGPVGQEAELLDPDG